MAKGGDRDPGECWRARVAGDALSALARPSPFPPLLLSSSTDSNKFKFKRTHLLYLGWMVN